MRAVRVLSIDGGGIRGIIPAVVLAEIEQRSGKRIHELFDLMAGTSTGGLLTLGLTRPGTNGLPHRAAELAQLYTQDGPGIFKRSLLHRLAALGNLLEEKYPADGLERTLHRYVGETKLSEALTDVFITAYDLESRQAFFFRSSRAKNDPQYDFPMTAAARATAAAPTYFEPLQLAGIGGDTQVYSLVDGGVYAGNPTMCAFVEARVLHPDATRFVVLSLGTGEQIEPIHHKQAKGWGEIGWVRPILSVAFDGITDTVDFQISQLIGRERSPLPDSFYLRLQTPLAGANDDMDDASPKNLRALKELGAQIVQKNTRRIDQLVELLAEQPD
ncbi:MAG: patatin-like phospholipase family protein [Acidimicrobiia bacterium]